MARKRNSNDSIALMTPLDAPLDPTPQAEPEPLPSVESFQQPKHELVYLPVLKLVPNPWNPQTMDSESFNRLVDEIGQVGFIAPMQVVPLDDGTYRIIGGEHRWKAAQVAGLKEVPCLLLSQEQWKDADLQKFVTVRLNILQGRLDPTKFIDLYKEMTDKYGEESLQQLLGFTDKNAFQSLLKDVKKGMHKALPKALQKEFDDAAKQVQTVEDLSKIIQTMFTRYGDTVNQSFMVFSHGAKQHIYIAMTSGMKKAMDKVIEYCRNSGEDINDFMEPITKAFMQTAEVRLKRMADTTEQAAELEAFAEDSDPED